ncbi:hypothetical protein PC116_g20962 [Phytophthora cactorum]|uniref:Crinkler effector protein N-terminal domain-containing protein n=1 Tax=Phytophthora cactorum TaxID=29920 RepID=A0A329RG67_9STRA|nr:hypothetical protein PC113_g23290 [Phytophthora cactorum]KAG2872870.1 hypothetical protein PC114_g26148 [Phytophthora cactorum]KAG2877726.1 hypothetical protein PC115_g23280 [Phytophthora cactorum]KAG2883453.1 hypothetical protein PC117_g26023 [Phytophthora cactorum]KAG2965396.1 hypothetical protein PC118_g19779 [Phytophthora cactorum]
MVTLYCAVVGVAGSAFPVDIDENKSVGHLKDAIKEKKMYQFPADKLQLFLAKTSDSGKWLRDDDSAVLELEEGRIHREIQTMINVGQLRPTWTIEAVLSANNMTRWYWRAPKSKQIHVLARIPRSTAGLGGDDSAWDAKDLSTVDPQVQLNIWQSVVRVSLEDVCLGTALVVDRTPTHLYLLTNLYTWIDKDETFMNHMSADFKKEIKRYLKLNPRMKTSGGKRKSAEVAIQPSRKSPRTLKKTPFPSDMPQVMVEQLLPDTTALTRVNQFSLHSGICWRSSADFDFAIFEVAVPPDIQLVRCKTSLAVYPTMSVHVFGFPGALQDEKFDHLYAIITAQVSGWSGNKMTLSSLSAPGLSGGAIVGTKRGVPVGYVGGGFDGSVYNEQYQSYGFTFHGIPIDLPSSLPHGY